MYYKEKPNIKIGVTHHGTFHADDVFSTALLKIIYPDIQIIRVNDVPMELKKKKEAIVYDVGQGVYDHHGVKAEFRTNGIEYSSFGKLWRDFGIFILPNSKSRAYIDSVLVQEIDKTDNGMGANTLSLAIKSFNISWNEKKERIDEQFNLAVEFAKQVLNNFIRRKLSEEEADKVYEEASAYQTNHVLVLPTYVPLSPNIRDNIWYIIYPSDRKGYNLSAIFNYKTGYRKPIPNEWRKNPPEGLNYIQDEGGKIANFNTIDNAIAAANSVTGETDQNYNNFLDVLIEKQWKFIDFDSNVRDIKGVYCMDNNTYCLMREAPYYSLNTLEKNENDNIEIERRSYGTIRNYNSKKRDYEKDLEIMDLYNKTSKVKILRLIYPNGTVTNATMDKQIMEWCV